MCIQSYHINGYQYGAPGNIHMPILWVVYHLQGETGWSTVCANGKQNLPNGKFRSRLARIICAIHSKLQEVWT